METLLQSRSILWLLVVRELRSRYAGSMLGAFWNIIHPLFLVAIYMLVFSAMMNRGGQGTTHGDYAIHLCAGMIPWLVFSETVTRSMNVLGENANFLKKLTLPHEVLHLSVLTNALLIHSVSMLAMLGILAAVNRLSGAQVLLAFPVMMSLGIFACGIGMALSVLNLLLRDIGQFTSLALQVVFWLTPIVYFPDTLPGGSDGLLYRVLRHNPVLSYVSCIQSLLGSPRAIFQDDAIHAMLFLPMASVLAGRWLLHRMRGELLDLL